MFTKKWTMLLADAIVIFLLWGGLAYADNVETDVAVNSVVVNSNQKKLNTTIAITDAKLKNSAQSQLKINRIDDKIQAMLVEYQSILRQINAYKTHNQQINRLIQSQQQDIASLDLQLNSIEDTKREILPFMNRMVVAFNQFVELDVPFLPDERHLRQERTNTIPDRADLSLAEKLRQIFEAYRIELDYGRNIEAYQGQLEIDGQYKTFNFLRVGRVGLYYLSLDENACGFWNLQTKMWAALPDEYISTISQGIDIAKKQLPPDLLRLPLPTPGVLK